MKLVALQYRPKRISPPQLPPVAFHINQSGTSSQTQQLIYSLYGVTCFHFLLGNTGSFLRDKSAVTLADVTPPSSAEVRNEWSCTYTRPNVLMPWCLIKLKQNFTCHVIYLAVLPTFNNRCLFFNMFVLNMKRRLLSLNTQFVPRSKHFSSRL